MLVLGDMKASIVIPFHNERDNVDFVLDEARKEHPDAEIIAIDDGSTDGTREMLDRHRPHITVIAFKDRLGKSAAVYAGLLKASNEACVMMDGDGQNDPKDISKLVSLLGQADLVCGCRSQRKDTKARIIAARLANSIRRMVLGDSISDIACGLKAIRREHVRHILPFEGFHRFLPILIANKGLKVLEIPVNHRPRHSGTSKYTIRERGIRGIRDLFGVQWFVSRQINLPDDLTS